MICFDYQLLVEKSKSGGNWWRKAMDLPLKNHDCQAAADLFVFLKKERNKKKEQLSYYTMARCMISVG